MWRHIRGNDPFAASPLRRTPYLVVTLFIAIVHFGLLSASKLLIVEKSQILPPFPGLGFDFIVILVFGLRYWPILLALHLGSSFWRHLGWLQSCGIAFAGLACTLAAVALFRWIAGVKRFLGPFEDMAGITLAGVVATAIGGAVGASWVAAAGRIPGSSWAILFGRWWVVDAISLFATSPTLLAIVRSWRADRPKRSYRFAFQLFAYLAAVSTACYLVFFRSNDGYLLFSAFLFVLIAAAWLGAAAARFTALIASFAAIAATRFGIGPFAGGNFRENLQNLVLFLVAISLTAMAVGAFRAIGSLRLPACALVAGWACSGWLYAGIDRVRTGYDQGRLDGIIETVESRIQGSYRAYEDLGWRAAEFAANSSPANPEAWHDYVARVSRPDRYPGLMGLSMVKSPGDSDVERASDLEAAALAADAATLRLFVPVYRAAAPLGTPAQRRSALEGWVRVAVDRDAFFHSALGDAQDIVQLRAFDNGGVVRAPRERVTRMTLGGQGWTLIWAPLPDFPYLSRGPFALAAGCTALLSLFLAGLVLILQTTRQRAQDRWKLLQAASAFGTWELDLDSETVHCSEQLLRLYGIAEPRDAISLTEWLGQVHPDDREQMAAEIGNRFGKRSCIDWQYRVLWRDGSIHWLHSKALPVIEDHGQLTRIVGVAFDISEIRQLQTQLAQAQKLQSVGELAAGVAHEINTPIQYIGDNGKFLEAAFRDLIRFSDALRRAGPKSQETGLEEGSLDYLRTEVPKAASQLLEGVDQVARIVRAMKEFSHPGPVDRSSADINRAIENTILVSRNEWKDVAEVTTDLDPDLPPVPCVVGEFNQVILNLIVNAAHAIADVVKDSGRRGSIHITTRYTDTMLEVRVADTGTGIPECIQSKIFDPFFTTKPVGKGTGQGLAIAHVVIVQKHNGSLTFESNPGRGTTFVIQLPLAAEVDAV